VRGSGAGMGTFTGSAGAGAGFGFSGTGLVSGAGFVEGPDMTGIVSVSKAPFPASLMFRLTAATVVILPPILFP
jgi:hypothetical protein